MKYLLICWAHAQLIIEIIHYSCTSQHAGLLNTGIIFRGLIFIIREMTHNRLKYFKII